MKNDRLVIRIYEPRRVDKKVLTAALLTMIMMATLQLINTVLNGPIFMDVVIFGIIAVFLGVFLREARIL